MKSGKNVDEEIHCKNILKQVYTLPKMHYTKTMIDENRITNAIESGTVMFTNMYGGNPEF